jgi:hypothetical protein
MPDTDTWRFNRNYKDKTQVEPFYPAYLAVYDELHAKGEYHYNDSFRGRIPGIEGPDEDAAIYLLQQLRSLKDLDTDIERYLADGGERIETLTETTKFASVVSYGFYVGGTGWIEWHDARIVPDMNQRPSTLLPKGKRTNGLILTGSVLVKRATK